MTEHSDFSLQVLQLRESLRQSGFMGGERRESKSKENGVRRTVVAPHASALIEGLRDIGYTFETAVADIIDNSITADARKVSILTEAFADEPYVAIVDDGKGMSGTELIEAMRAGSRNPLAARDEPDLGRFGLGLKSASFSQCRRLTVVSRQSGQTHAAIWDLDDVAERNEWSLQLPDDLAAIPAIEYLGPEGTLVLWQKLDRLGGGHTEDATRQARIINQKTAEAERHFRLVFHRFMGEGRQLEIALNGRPLKPLDPFAEGNSRTISDPEEILPLPNGIVRIQSFTLPHHRQTTKAEWEEIGGPEGHLKSQGFYVYRGNRLIVHGTWFGLCRQLELSKLSRVRIDIPNSMDADWKIDVKKSSAQLPPLVRDRLKKVIERIQAGSKRTYRKRGQRLVDDNRMPLWHRIQSDGEIRYQPNSDHPVIAGFAELLPPELQQGFFNCISIVGASLPIDTLHADMAGTAEQVMPGRLDDDTLAQAVRSTVKYLRASGVDDVEIAGCMKDAEPFRSAWAATQRLLVVALQRDERKGA